MYTHTHTHRCARVHTTLIHRHVTRRHVYVHRRLYACPCVCAQCRRPNPTREPNCVSCGPPSPSDERQAFRFWLPTWPAKIHALLRVHAWAYRSAVIISPHARLEWPVDACWHPSSPSSSSPSHYICVRDPMNCAAPSLDADWQSYQQPTHIYCSDEASLRKIAGQIWADREAGLSGNRMSDGRADKWHKHRSAKQRVP